MTGSNFNNRLPVNRKLLTRLFSKINISAEHFYQGTPCWEWIGGKDKDGYGKTTYTYSTNNKKHYRTHRLFYDLFCHMVPLDLVVDHLCRNVACCNPIHLDPVTSLENIRRGGCSLKTHCPHGHEYTAENCLPRANGKRDCRTCSYTRKKNQRLKDNQLPFDDPVLIKRRKHERERWYRRTNRPIPDHLIDMP